MTQLSFPWRSQSIQDRHKGIDREEIAGWILSLLTADPGPWSATGLATELGVSRKLVSQALMLLEDRGQISVEVGGPRKGITISEKSVIGDSAIK